MENGALVMERLTPLTDTFLTGAQGAEVFDSFGNGVTKKTHHNPTRGIRGSLNFDVKVHFTGNGFGFTRNRKSEFPKERMSFRPFEGATWTNDICTHLEAVDDRAIIAITNRVTKTEDAINFMVSDLLADSLLALFFQKFNCRREKGRLESNCMKGRIYLFVSSTRKTGPTRNDPSVHPTKSPKQSLSQSKNENERVSDEGRQLKVGVRGA